MKELLNSNDANSQKTSNSKMCIYQQLIYAHDYLCIKTVDEILDIVNQQKLYSVVSIAVKTVFNEVINWIVFNNLDIKTRQQNLWEAFIRGISIAYTNKQHEDNINWFGKYWHDYFYNMTIVLTDELNKIQIAFG